MLTTEDVIPFLLEQRCLTRKHVVDGALSVLDASRRNRNFKVINENGPSYFLKQGVGSERSSTVAHEAGIYRFLQAIPGYQQEVAEFMPRFHRYVPEQGILVLELCREGQSLIEFFQLHNGVPQYWAKLLGKALGKLHKLTGREEIRKSYHKKLTSFMPFAFQLPCLNLKILAHISGANFELIKIINQSEEFCQLLEEIKKEWQYDALIHGDLRWDNCNVFSGSDFAPQKRLKIVDWEMAVLGDSCWDLGTVFGEYLNFWLLSTPLTKETEPQQFLQLAAYPLKKLQPSVRAFWESYRRQVKLDPAQSGNKLLRAVKYAGLKLIQAAYEGMQLHTKPTAQVIYLLQLSLNILKRPHEASVQLLGLPFASS